jgi:hypothetical protein
MSQIGRSRIAAIEHSTAISGRCLDDFGCKTVARRQIFKRCNSPVDQFIEPGANMLSPTRPGERGLGGNRDRPELGLAQRGYGCVYKNGVQNEPLN